MSHWTEFGIRRLPPMSARSRVVEIPPPIQAEIDKRFPLLKHPLTGISTGGVPTAGLFPLHSTGVSTAPIAEAAQAFLSALDAAARAKAQLPLDADEWRTWLNVHMNFFRHGVMLEDLPVTTRQLALDLVRATLSARGYGLARDIMRLNELLAELTGSPDEYGEWPYFVTVFGDPSSGAPWGWQIDGHHLVVNCVVVDDNLVLTPTFMGSEPCHVHEGPLAGTEVFVAEERAGLDLVRSLDEVQAARAILRPSIHPDDLPLDMQHPFDGRMVAGAFNDNAVIGHEGVAARDFSDAQRQLLRSLVGGYVGWTRDGHAEVKMAEVEAHLDDTWFSWMGATGEKGPFYYRVHSPVVLIEFDHHPGVVFDNKEPSRNHVHTIVRTPNGGDYGADLLRQHHERYDHSHGHHDPRS
ncbi:MAG: hypothetical protein ACI8TP_002140 [Acidimicrobiales bacterium]|jgi:hypothetical protein